MATPEDQDKGKKRESCTGAAAGIAHHDMQRFKEAAASKRNSNAVEGKL